MSKNLSSYWLAHFYFMNNLPRYCARSLLSILGVRKPSSKHEMYGFGILETGFSEKRSACAHSSYTPKNERIFALSGLEL